jgi:hypothetical protein
MQLTVLSSANKALLRATKPRDNRKIEESEIENSTQGQRYRWPCVLLEPISHPLEVLWLTNDI